MFLKFWMIFAKSLSFVYDEIFHIRNCCVFTIRKRVQMTKSLLLNFSFKCRKGFYIIYFVHQTVYLQSSRKVFFALSFAFFSQNCNFTCCCTFSIHFTPRLSHQSNVQASCQKVQVRRTKKTQWESSSFFLLLFLLLVDVKVVKVQVHFGEFHCTSCNQETFLCTAKEMRSKRKRKSVFTFVLLANQR